MLRRIELPCYTLSEALKEMDNLKYNTSIVVKKSISLRQTVHEDESGISVIFLVSCDIDY